MKLYAVIFKTSAQENVRESYDWGCRAWGKKEAQRWVRDLRSAIVRQLSIVPKGFPLRLKTTNSRRRFASSSWAAIASYSLFEKAKSTYFMFEAHTIGIDFS